MSELHPYTVKIEAETKQAVLVQIVGMGIKPWLPRSKVTFPAGIKNGDVIEVQIPGWLIKNEIGEPF
ncbi:MAG: hypothetical protein JEY79_18585 [Pseudodesulfovibrio sp.]|jgi:hypothetical protein|nr:hypothetical protein [Pseudodesulfovibrio sp.]